MVYTKYILNRHNLYKGVYTKYIMVKQKLRKLEVELDEDDEIIQREVKDFGNASHIVLPQKHRGKKATIIIKK